MNVETVMVHVNTDVETQMEATGVLAIEASSWRTTDSTATVGHVNLIEVGSWRVKHV